MSLGRALAVAIVGSRGHLVEVEADIASGLPTFGLVGLPDVALNEARDRVRAAAANSGHPLPQQRITVNLSPAGLPKAGTGFDLAVAAALMSAAGVAPSPRVREVVHIGELGLDGRVRPVRGVLPAVLAAVQGGRPEVVVPFDNAVEARLVPGSRVHPVHRLADVIELHGGAPAEDCARAAQESGPEPDGRTGARPHSKARSGPGNRSGSSSESGLKPESVSELDSGTIEAARGSHDQDAEISQSAGNPGAAVPDLADVIGQHQARRALEVAAAGHHHLLLLGPPGAGKTMLAARLPGLLPDLPDADAVEVTAVHSLAGTLVPSQGLIRRPPYENPHHTSTVVSLVGGGSGLAQPGAASRAHRGVLFLDEAAEFDPRVLDALRQPLEHGELVIYRAQGAARFPARFQLVLAANPCPCGLAAGSGLDCTCAPSARRRYLARLSGPLLDRVDIQVEVFAVSGADLASTDRPESSAQVASRVAQARATQRERLQGTPWRSNSEVTGAWLRRTLRLAPAVTRDLDHALDRGRISIRGYDRVLRLAWTLADLAGRTVPGRAEIGGALLLRQRGRTEP